MINKISFSKENSQYIFGTQYYRAPTPLSDEWQDDIRKIKEMNFNTIKIWIQWRWVESKKGQYDFSDFDRLFELCLSNDIKIVPNLVAEVPPEWFLREHPEARIKNMERNTRYDWGHTAYQIGGFRPCPDHPANDLYSMEFIKKVAERYKGHPCLLAWDVWNEPIQEFCSCDYSHASFVKWLENRFDSIDEFNNSTGKRYGSFDEIPIPYEIEDFTLMYLKLNYMTDRLAELIYSRTEVIRKVDKTTPVTTHTLGPGSSVFALWNVSPKNMLICDDWKSIKSVDFMGTSLHQWENCFNNPKHNEIWFLCPLCLDAMRSASPYFWVTEIASGENHYGFDTYGYNYEDVRFWTWTSLAHGAKAMLYWQYKPERVGPEAPGFGLVTLDGRMTKHGKEAEEAADFAREWSGFLSKAEPVTDKIGILWSGKNHIMTELASIRWKGNPYTNPYSQGVKGVYQSMQYNDLAPCIIHENDDLSDIKVLYLPVFIFVDEKLSDKIKQFVYNGGIIVSEGGLGSYDRNAWHNINIPGSILEEVFSIKELGASLRKDDDIKFNLRIGEYEYNMSGTLFKRDVQAVKASIVGYFAEDNSPAVFKNNYGKGTAYYIATHPSIKASITWDMETMFGIYKFLESAINHQYCVDKKGFVSTRMLENGQERLLFVFNHEESVQNVVIKVPDYECIRAVRGSEAKDQGGGYHISVSPRDVAVYYLKRI